MAGNGKYRIMGIDPGTNYTGYGVLEIEGRLVRSVVLGDIDLHKMSDPYEKLRYIFQRVGALIEEYGPSEVALESPFFGENVQSMLKLGRAQGVAMAAALSHDRPVYEYAPTRIKQSITGTGSASKEQVASTIERLLKIDKRPRRNDILGNDRVKGLGGERKAVKRGSSSWEKFLRENPEREIK